MAQSHLRSHSQISEKQQTKSGWLQLKSHSLLKLYKKRYLLLENKQLSIFENENKENLKAIINFNQVLAKVSIDHDDPHKLLLKFEGNSCIFHFKGACEEISEWYSCIFSNIKITDPEERSCKIPSLKSSFYKYCYITPSQFASKTETGDIVLFKGKSKICGAIRGVLKCDFDHIAVVYVLNNLVYLFESTRSTGVVLTSWDEFVNRKWFGLYSRVAFRKLMIERNKSFFEIAHHFVAEAEGKPYKLLKMKANNTDGYFCSELVAEFYRRTGVIYQNKPAYKFWPKNFAISGGINIIQGDLGMVQDIKF